VLSAELLVVPSDRAAERNASGARAGIVASRAEFTERQRHETRSALRTVVAEFRPL
jgi:hypothetical protein